MTAPIQEPTEGRTTSGLGYGQRQLYRRPAPLVNTGPIVFRAEQWNIDTTVTNNDWVVVHFDEWSNPDDTIFSENMVSGNIESVDLLVPGYVVAKLAWQWSSSWQTDALLESQGGAIEDNINVWQREAIEFLRVVIAGEDYSFTISEVYPTIAFDAGHGGNELPTFSFWLSQKTGANKDAQARFTIAYWPATSGSTIIT